MSLALSIARRELRAGLSGGARGFRVFLLCLMLGVAAISAVGLVREAIRQGMRDQGATLLGGDVEYAFTYRRATEAERGWILRHASALSEVIGFRSMLGTMDGTDFALTQVKAVDGAYPLTGALEITPAGASLQPVDGVPGAYLDPLLADRLGLHPGDRFTLGGQTFEMRARILHEPDAGGAGIAFGPRTIVALSAIEGTPLLSPGSLYDSDYRVMLRPGETLSGLKQQAEARFHGAGMRWADSRRPSPAAERFTNQLAAFLVLIGLAGLAVGGVGISAATSAWMAAKADTIATLKALGATSGEVMRAFGLQIAAIACIGVCAGLGLGAGGVWLLGGKIAAALPFPAEIALRFRPLAEAALFGFLTVALFTLWPLGRTTAGRTAGLYRQAKSGGRPAWRVGVLSGGVLLAIVAVACVVSGRTGLTLAVLGSVGGALLILSGAAFVLRWIAVFLRPLARGRAVVHLALAAIGSPAGDSRAVLLSLGLGLSVLSAIGQVESGLRTAISRDVPKVAPAFFLVDILPDDRASLIQTLSALPGVSRIETAPMLRGVISKINGRPAREVAGDHWVLRGDRGVTFADSPREKLTAGRWWPKDYAGPPQASFAAKEAKEIGLHLGDKITVNILGRDIEAEITSLRDVDFSTAGIGFVLTLDPAALAGAPHTDIATVYATPEAEASVLRKVGQTFPNVTAIGVREALGRVNDALGAVSRAVMAAASVTLAVGFVVLIGAAAAGEGTRAREAALLKSLGATRGQILGAFALRAGIAGAAASAVALFAGVAAGWAVMTQVMELSYTVSWGPAMAILALGIGVTVGAYLVFAVRPLAVRPAAVLREKE